MMEHDDDIWSPLVKDDCLFSAAMSSSSDPMLSNSDDFIVNESLHMECNARRQNNLWPAPSTSPQKRVNNDVKLECYSPTKRQCLTEPQYQTTYMVSPSEHILVKQEGTEYRTVVKPTRPHYFITRNSKQRLVLPKPEPLDDADLSTNCAPSPTDSARSSSSPMSSDGSTNVGAGGSKMKKVWTTANLSAHQAQRSRMHQLAIRSNLISNQDFTHGDGPLVLSAEERRTLVQEGYPVPTRLPLTKCEQEALKIVRRKIKNKLSAQESRRKRKEYMDELEAKVAAIENENLSLRERLVELEEQNQQLQSQITDLTASSVLASRADVSTIDEQAFYEQQEAVVTRSKARK